MNPGRGGSVASDFGKLPTITICFSVRPENSRRASYGLIASRTAVIWAVFLRPGPMQRGR